ncbi:MAG: energy transducer TonB [Hyphomicrobium sp.]
MEIRILTFLLSSVVHAGFAAWLLITPGSASLQTGENNDDFVVEKGIAIEGLSTWGNDDTNVDALEAVPLEQSKAQQEIKEEKKPEEVETTELITSENGPEQEKKMEKTPEVSSEQLTKQVATLEQSEQIAVDEKRAATKEKSGGDTTAHTLYLGQLRSHLEKRKVNPRSKLTGKTVVRFTVDPTGHLLTHEIAESSGIKVLDDAALASVKKAAPFPAMPQEIARGEPLIVSVPFRFTIR